MPLNNIVQVNVSITNPPIPDKLQKTGAFISQGATNTSNGTLTPLTSAADLTAILAGAKTLTSLTWAAGVVTGTVSGGHGLPAGETITITVSGNTPAAYNGTFAASVTSSTQFTYPLVTNPGTNTVLGAVTPEDVAELVAMNTTFFAQGNNTAVYVMELGAGNAADGVTALNTYLVNNPNTIYSFLVPRYWDAETTFKTMVANYTAPSNKVNFFVTTTISTYSAWVNTDNDVFAMVEAPTIPVTEFSCAAPFYTTLNWSPNSANRVPPLCFSFEYGVTPYPLKNNQTLLTQLKTANIGYIDTGAEGGLVNTLIKWGHVLSGEPFNYWYTVDWAQITLELDLANEVINGSNNNLAPLYYNQDGIDRLQNRAAKTMRNGVSYGLILGNVTIVALDPIIFGQNVAAGQYAGQAVINAVPFTIYNKANPSDYMLGKYAGLQVAFTPARGFEQIIVNINVSNVVA